jgi:hypothetical protein
LDGLDWEEIGCNRKKTQGIHTEGSFRMGMATRAYHYANGDTAGGPDTAGLALVPVYGNTSSNESLNGPFKPFSFREGMGVFEGGATVKRHRALWDLCKNIVQIIDPGYKYTSVQVFACASDSKHRSHLLQVLVIHSHLKYSRR